MFDKLTLELKRFRLKRFRNKPLSNIKVKWIWEGKNTYCVRMTLTFRFEYV